VRAPAVFVLALLASTVFVTLYAPYAEATHQYVLVRLGSLATGSSVKSVDISADGRWAVAGSTVGSVRLFDLDSATPAVPVWTSPDINVSSLGIRGSNHAVTMSSDGMYIAAATQTTAACVDPTAFACLFLFRRDGGGTPLWSRPFQWGSSPAQVPSDVTGSYVVAGTSVFDIAGNLYWRAPRGAQQVDITEDGRYLAVSTGWEVDLYENSGVGFDTVFSFTASTRPAMYLSLDLAEDGKGLAVAEEDVFDDPECCYAYQFYPAMGFWTGFDVVPCLTVQATDDLAAVAVAGESSSNSGERMVTGRSWGVSSSVEYGFCDAMPTTTWATGVAFAADASRAGCTPPDPCFAVFGSFDHGVYLVQERETEFDVDFTGGEVHAIAMSDEAYPRIVAGSQDGSVYLYRVIANRPDYVPWAPAPGGEVRINVSQSVDLFASVANVGPADSRMPSTIAFVEEGAASPFYTAPVAALPAGSQSPRYQATWTAPTTPGIYRIQVVVDRTDAILEADEGNNVHTFVLNVTAAPTPPPITTLVIGTPRVDAGLPYVTSATPLSLSVLDVGGSGIAATWYRIDVGPWLEFATTGPFVLSSEGEHLIEWYSEDNVGAREEVQEARGRVDDTPPTTLLSVGSPNYVAAETFVTSATAFSLASEDQGATPVGLARTECRIDAGPWFLYATPFTLGGEGPHLVDYAAVDLLGNREPVQGGTFVVDDSPPTLAVVAGDPHVTSFDTWVTSSTPIEILSSDAGLRPVGLEGIEYRSWSAGWSSWLPYGAPFTLGGEGLHYVEAIALDLLGLASMTNGSFIVDDTPPAATLDVGLPRYNGADPFVTSRTPIRIPSADGGPIPVGLDAVEYRIDAGPWTPHLDEFTLANEGPHTVGWRAWDRLSNAATPGTLSLILDDSAPVVRVETSGPSFVEDALFVTTATSFSLQAVDGGVVPVGVRSLEYRIDGGAWADYAGPFALTGSDGLRTIEYRAADLLGNTQGGSLEVVLDNTPPITTPSHLDGTYPPETRFSFVAADVWSGVASTEYQVDDGDWTLFGGAFGLAAGHHVVRFRSSDRLDNRETERSLSLRIENAPVTTLSVSETNWKPVVAAVFSTTLFLAGVWAARRAPWRTGTRPALRAFAVTSLPFVAAEALTGVVSLTSGLFTIPPLLGAGIAVDVLILIVGIAASARRVRGTMRPR